MKILITGGNGFVGSHILRSILSEGHEIVLLKRQTSDLWRIRDLLSKISCHNIEETDFKDLFTQGKPIDAVIHAATVYGRKDENLKNVYQGNIQFPFDLLSAAVDAECPCFINLDTFFCLYSSDLNHLTNYIMSKRIFHELGKRFGELKQIRFFNLQLFHVYGALDSTDKFTTGIIRRLLNNEPEIDLTSGEQKRDFICVDDVAQACLAVLRTGPKTNEFYKHFEVGSGQTVTVREFVEAAHKITNSSSQLRFGAIPMRQGDTECFTANIEPLQQIGWNPNIQLESGLQELIKDIDDRLSGSRENQK